MHYTCIYSTVSVQGRTNFIIYLIYNFVIFKTVHKC
jgi:hypothetical protein